MEVFRKITSVVLVFLASTVCFIHCYSEDGSNSIEIKSTWEEQLQTANNWELGTMEKALDEIANTPLEELSPVHCSLFAICLPGQGYPGYIAAATEMHYLHDLNREAPIEHIEKIDNDHVFVLYKIFEEEKEAYLRVLLRKNTVEYANMEEPVERWDIDNSYFINSVKNLRYKDFAGIKIGDSALDVAAIDDTLEFDIGVTQTVYDNITVFSSRKLLNDGILVITYSAPKKQDGSAIANEDYKVVDIYFNKNKNDIDALRKSPNRTPYLWDSILTRVWIAVAVVIIAGAVTAILVLRRRKRATASAIGAEAQE